MADSPDSDSPRGRAGIAAYYCFRDKPFQGGDLEAFYDNPNYEHACNSLLEGIRRGAGVSVLLGKPGTGKTLLLRKLMREASPQLQFIFCYSANLDFDDLLTFVCDRLGLQVRVTDRGSRLGALGEYLRACQDQEMRVALLLDEAHKLPETTLAELLSWIRTAVEDGHPLRIVLSGAPALEQRLERHRPSIPLLDKAPRVYLQALSAEETSAFVHHQLEIVGGQAEKLFPPPVLERIAKYAQGIPRRIIDVCDQALLLACQKGEKQVTLETIEEAIGKCDAETAGTGPAAKPVPQMSPPARDSIGREAAPSQSPGKTDSPARWAALLIVVGVLAGGVISYLVYQSSRGRETALVASDQPAEVADRTSLDRDPIRQGDEAFGRGDVEVARDYYQSAAERGRIKAMIAFAKTYDPVELNKRGLDNIRPDPLQAAVWYLKARNAGDVAANQGLAELRRWLEHSPDLDPSERSTLQTLLQSEASSPADLP